MKNKIITYCLILSILLIIGFLVSCERKTTVQNQNVIATVGKKTIDWNHLQRSFELTPKWGKGLTYKQAYQVQLDFLIDEKLFSQAALGEEIHRDPKTIAYLEFIQKKELIKELYRQQVKSEIQISESEYKAAYLKAKKKVQFNYIFSPSLENAEFYQKSLEKIPFDEIPLMDPQNDAKGTSPMFGFGDMQQELEDVVFELEKDEISQPIEIENGYMIVRVIDGKIDKFASERDYQEMRSKIEKVIFERKSRKAANSYVKNLMLDKNLTLNPPIFFTLSDQLSKIIQDKVSETPLPIFVNDEEIDLTQRSVSEIMDEVLATHRDGQMTVRDFLNELMNMPADLRPNVKMPIQLKNVIGVIVRNDYLAKQAEELGLRDHPNVIYETTIQKDEILSKLWFRKYIERHKGSLTQDKLAYPVSQKQIKNEELQSIIDLQELRLSASDSLQKIYPVTLDTALYTSQIKHPKDTIRFNPVNIVVRELFN